MIVSLIVGALIGAVAGASLDSLVRGRDPSSRTVVAAGIAGALAAVMIRRAISDEGMLVEALAALAGALLIAFATRARLSGVISRGSLP